ncbi:MAG: UDP-2,3-diacylglucosamine diphosphatase [Bacteroidales bacterium]|nr:UDP-2,3-diacylglucosamine diphosphatase [Bacteroidales bacterium]
MYICTVKNSIQNTPIVELHGNCLFVSDAHFRTPPDEASMDRELKLVQLFKNQEDKLQHIFFLGDIFDYWFEYRDVVPKGYVTLFACLKELHAQGTQIHYFTGNHDMWVENYFTQTFGATVYHEARLVYINGHRCFVGHGDGLGGKQRKYLLIKRILNSKFNQRLYSMLHPRQSFAISRFFSEKSRNSHDESMLIFKGEDEFQVQFARELLQTTDVEFFVFAHRHVPTRYELAPGHLFFNTGDWLDNFSYVTFGTEDPEPVLHS